MRAVEAVPPLFTPRGANGTSTAETAGICGHTPVPISLREVRRTNERDTRAACPIRGQNEVVSVHAPVPAEDEGSSPRTAIAGRAGAARPFSEPYRRSRSKGRHKGATTSAAVPRPVSTRKGVAPTERVTNERAFPICRGYR